MKNSLLMDFSVDKEKKEIIVKREFAAPVSKVWAAWTQEELLDQWWAPKPWKAKTKKMEFKDGGSWLYAMVGPDGEEHWARADYKNIKPLKSYTAYDAFCDAEGNINKELPRSLWNTEFNEEKGSTFVHIVIKHDKPEDLETTIRMGFKEGFLAALENLDAVL